MKNILVCSFLSIILACNSKREIVIRDVGRDTSIMVKTSARYPTALRLKIWGNVDDTFIIRNFYYIPGGKVDTMLNYDWYHPDFQIDYKAYRAKKGELYFDYEL